MNAIVKSQPLAVSTVTSVQNIDDVIKMADIFHKSGMFTSDSGVQSAAQLAVKIMAGQEIGIAPFAAANGMYIVKGKCAPGANLMAAKVKSSGRYNYAVQRMDDQACEIVFFEMGTKIGVSVFTIQDAQKAGTQNLQKYPRNMLFARAMSNGVKWFCPDVFNGVAVYTPDEMGAPGEYDEEGEFVVSEAQLQPAQKQMQPQPVATQPVIQKQDAPTPKSQVVPPSNGHSNGSTTTPHKRLFGEGITTFSPARWDELRPTIVSAITNAESESESALTDTEREALADSFKANRRQWQMWASGKGAMPQVPIREIDGDELEAEASEALATDEIAF